MARKFAGLDSDYFAKQQFSTDPVRAWLRASVTTIVFDETPLSAIVAPEASRVPMLPKGRVLRRLRRIEQLPQAERRFVLKIIEALVEKRSRSTARE